MSGLVFVPSSAWLCWFC